MFKLLIYSLARHVGLITAHSHVSYIFCFSHCDEFKSKRRLDWFDLTEAELSASARGSLLLSLHLAHA